MRQGPPRERYGRALPCPTTAPPRLDASFPPPRGREAGQERRLRRKAHLQLLLLLLDLARPRHLRAPVLVGHAARHSTLFGRVDLGMDGIEPSGGALGKRGAAAHLGAPGLDALLQVRDCAL